MKNKFFSTGLAVLFLMFFLSACTEKQATELPDAQSTAMYDAIETVMKCEELNKDSKYVKALALADKLIAQHGHANEKNLQAELAKAMLQKGVALAGLKHTDKALIAFDALLKRFGNAQSIELQEQVAKALLNKGYALYDLKKTAEEIQAYDEVISRFASATDIRLLEQVAVAQNNKGYASILQAKQAWADVNTRNYLLNQALSSLELAIKTEATETKAMALGNKAYSTWLLGRTDEAKSPLQAALKLGGQWLYEGEINDTKQFTVPEDAGFTALLKKVWEDAQPKVKQKKDNKDAGKDQDNAPAENKKSGNVIHI